jgi:hypothetical protein
MKASQTIKQRQNQLKKLFKKFDKCIVLYAPFDSGQNLLKIAGIAKNKKETVPFVVNSSKMVLFYA